MVEAKSNEDRTTPAKLSVEVTEDSAKKGGQVVKGIGESARYSAVIAIMLVAFFLLRKKLSGISWDNLCEAMGNVSTFSFFLAIGITCANFLLLTGYDLIAVRYLKKDIPLRRVMMGAVVGYALSNVLGWILGGTAVRYRLYSKWGFTLVEIVAFISIISITFWLGMFLLAGIAFVALPVQLPPVYAEGLFFSPQAWGWIFLCVVMMYLLASAFIRKPIHWHEYRFSLPPLKLSAMQLIVSAGDFVLASAVLYVLLPSTLRGPDAIHFSTVLVAYLAAMIVVVIVHVPGGFGVLEIFVLELMPENANVPVMAALVLFRVIYYLIPALFAVILLAYNEWSTRQEKLA